MADAPVIEIKKLSKRYRGREAYALKDLTLNVMAGEVFGFLGPNGAGKTTTIRTLMNFIQPSSGSAKILGKDIVDDSVELKRHIGFLSGETVLYPKATGHQLLKFLEELTPGAQSRFKELAKQFDVDLSKPLGELSKGNRQKIGLIQAFMHEPKVLILDEPTSGLDPLMQEQFFQLVGEAKARGAAIFLSSHILAEAQRICDRVGILKAGRLIREQAVGSEFGQPVFRVTFENHASLSELKKSGPIKLITSNGNMATLQATGSISEALAALSKYEIMDFVTDKLDLESEFMEFYGEAK